MNTFLFCYANNRDYPLKYLGEEDANIDRLLDLRSSKNHFQLVRDSFATTDSITSKILTYQTNLSLFHFSGHANSDVLLFENSPARGEGIAKLLANCPNLQLIFLNGCSTLNHIRLLIDQKVKAAIIATATPVADSVASKFAVDFYQAMADQYSLQQALNLAESKILVTTDVTIQRTYQMTIDTAQEISQNEWVFYCPDDTIARWEFPTGSATQATDYVPNEVLRSTLFEALQAYDPTLTQSYKAKQGMPANGLRDWQNEEILRRLPFPISEPLRKLFCPDMPFEGKLIQPQPTQERLNNYIHLFNSSIDLLLSALLSQIRSWLQENTPLNQVKEVDPVTQQILQRIVTVGWADWGVEELLSTIRTLQNYIDQQNIPYFIRELKTWLNLFGTDIRLTESLRSLFTLKTQLAQPNGISNIPSRCQLGEEYLSEWLKYAGFWAIYRLESFKNIRAIRFYQQPPTYRHEMVVLRTSQSYRNDERYFQEVQLDDLWDCQSVLLVKIQRRLTQTGPVEEIIPTHFLNLAPFIIDRNVFLKSDNAVFDLYSFQSGVSSQLCYRHIARPNKKPLVIQSDEGHLLGQQDFSVLREQIGALWSLLSIATG